MHISYGSNIVGFNYRSTVTITLVTVSIILNSSGRRFMHRLIGRLLDSHWQQALAGGSLPVAYRTYVVPVVRLLAFFSLP